MKIKKNDTVLVLTGKDNGKTGKVVSVSPKEGMVKVEGVNIQTKHKKPKNAQDQGGKVTQIGAIDASNVMVVCPKCNKAVRVAYKVVDGKNVRVCRKCGAVLDVAAVKEAKKTTKKAAKAQDSQEVKETKTAKKTAAKKTTAKAAKVEKADKAE